MGIFDMFKKSRTNSKVSSNTDSSQQGYINVGKNIFPIIKRKSDPMLTKLTENSIKLISRSICEDLTVVYALDTGKQYEYLNMSNIGKYGLNLESLDAIAMRNIKQLSKDTLKITKLDFSDQDPRLKPFFGLRLNGNLEPSVMLIEEFWSQITSICNDNLIAVIVPAKNELYFSSFKVMESFRTMKVFKSNQWEEAVAEKRELSDSVYVLKNSRWYIFQDEPDFFEEMYKE